MNRGNISACSDLSDNPNTPSQILSGVIFALSVQTMIHFAHQFIRNHMWNIPPGSKTALADISILASFLLEVQVMTGLLPFASRLTTGYFSLELTVFWSYAITASHLALTTCLSSFVLLRIFYIFFFDTVNSFSDESIALGKERDEGRKSKDFALLAIKLSSLGTGIAGVCLDMISKVQSDIRMKYFE